VPKINFIRALALCVFSFGAVVARGYVLLTDESNIYAVKWYVNPVTMQVKLSNVANLADGNSYQSSVVSAMNSWNAQLRTVQLAPVLSSPGTHRSGNGINEISMDSTIDGDAFSSGTLAVTLSYGHGNDYAESDIIINTAYTWDSYRGNLRSAEDLQRVVIHELGHVLGLDHPDEHGQFVTAIMNSHASNLDRLQADDIAGAQVNYASTGATPPTNDSFAVATPLALTTGRAQVTGSTVLATRETGEPLHATSTGAHSIWWRWTAPASGGVSATTLGSNFDTVLGVYTGTSVSALTRIADNDDEETIEQNPNDNRKRTSLVAFNAVAGTTYYFAVDGWGDTDGLAEGYTGTVTLAVTFTPTAPIFTTQPVAAALPIGSPVTFSASASSTTTPQWQWQQNGAAITGATQSSYSIASPQPTAAGIYTAVATTTTGSATSSPAIFGVSSTQKTTTGGSEVGINISHPNGNVYDQVLLQAADVAVTADPGQVVRLSFIDLSNDIVQVEFAGAGTLNLVLDNPTGPAAAENYVQPDIRYMKGHAGIVIVGANETTNVSVFSVGRANAVNQSLFRSDVTYDGLADIAFIAILSPTGKFGGLRAANTSFFATRGLTGVYAPGVAFTGPVFVGDISASDAATPVIRLGATTQPVQINGGDLLQANNRAVQISGFTQLQFVDGSTSHGALLTAKTNRARLEQDGVDVTTQVVVNPR
jgi:hypothetical protein